MCMNDNVAIAVANPREPQVTIVVVAREDAGAEPRKPDAYHHRIFSFFDSSKRMRRLCSAASAAFPQLAGGGKAELGAGGSRASFSHFSSLLVLETSADAGMAPCSCGGSAAMVPAQSHLISPETYDCLAGSSPAPNIYTILMVRTEASR